MWPQTAKIFHFGERFAPLPGSATTGVERHAKISESSEIGCKVCVQHFEHLAFGIMRDLLLRLGFDSL